MAIHENTRQELHRPKIAVLTSGAGSTTEALVHATQDGRLRADVGLVICNNRPEKAGVWQRVAILNEQYGLDIEMARISGATHPSSEATMPGRGQTLAESEAIAERIRAGNFDMVMLLGYMKITRGALQQEYGWHPGYTSTYQSRMLNTHPGPLPETADTYGIHASEKVLALGMEASKHTLHLVASGVDEGPVVAEQLVPVLPGDTADNLFQRVQAAEKAALPAEIGAFLEEQRAYESDSS